VREKAALLKEVDMSTGEELREIWIPLQSIRLISKEEHATSSEHKVEFAWWWICQNQLN